MIFYIVCSFSKGIDCGQIGDPRGLQVDGLSCGLKSMLG